MGTITASSGVYRAFKSDQGLVSLAFTLRRKNGMEEVVGSIPTRSTIFSSYCRHHASGLVATSPGPTFLFFRSRFLVLPGAFTASSV